MGASPEVRGNSMLKFFIALLALGFATPALAAEGLDGRGLSLLWALPFVGLLLTIATGPMLFPRLWHHHYGKIAAGWALLTVLPLALVQGAGVAVEAVLHTLLLEYVSFIVLLFALYTVAGGILVAGNLRGTPAVNTGILGLGTVLASLVGTTGASMILIRPLIRANDDRTHTVHLVVFFIFLVSNIGGSLTPLGDPPLFIGFLRGIDFFWTTKALLPETLLVSAGLLAIFYVWDSILMKNEAGSRDDFATRTTLKDKTPDSAIKLYGLPNIALMGAIIVAILGAAAWKPGITIAFPGGHLDLQNIARDIALLVIALMSLGLTPKPVRAGNDFSWGPIAEVAKLFAAIFLCMIPVLAILAAGRQGALGPLVALVSNADGSPNNTAYFWLTGMLSALLDNAPTYLVFFQLAGGDPAALMGPLAVTLNAISAAAVFMGALTYIGNAPNLMVAVIARDMGVKMPGFFGYIGWSFGLLGPFLALVWWFKFAG
jgi:Na+/H+ antiporter NhaD/arsenite permease-like protein